MSLFLNIFAKLRNFVARRYPKLFVHLLRHKSFVKFFMAGPMVGIVDLSVLFILHGLLNIPVLWSTSLAYIVSFWASFYLQKFWTFCNHNKKHVYRQLILYFLFAFLNFNLNGYMMYKMVNDYHIWYLLAQVIVSLLIGLISFLVYKFIVFRKHHDDI